MRATPIPSELSRLPSKKVVQPTTTRNRGVAIMSIYLSASDPDRIRFGSFASMRDGRQTRLALALGVMLSLLGWQGTARPAEEPAGPRG